MAKILLVEDDETISAIVTSVLQRDRHHVEVCNNGASGAEMLMSGQFDLAVLDWQLPKLSGVELCSQVRAKGLMVLILMLTSRSGSANIQTGLQAGADDYLIKPFEAAELSIRVSALLRRPTKIVANELQCGDLVLTMDSGQATIRGATMELTDIEYAVLQFLLRHQGELFSAEQLLDRVWKSESDATYSAVTSCMKRLRRKLEQSGNSPSIKSAYGKGYKLEA